jgi:uncharacterized protein
MDNRNLAGASQTRATYDAGLRAHFQKVYNMMALGLVVTGATAYGVASTPELFRMFNGTILGLIVSLSPLGIIFFGLTPSRMNRMSVTAVSGLYYLLTALIGVSLSYIFMMYTGGNIARVFFITAGMFAATSIYGYTTRKDLTGLGSLMFMGLIGLIIASLVNIFLQSPMVYFVTSWIGVVVFTGLIAFDTQNIKESYSSTLGRDTAAKMAVMGALGLYLNFINLFIMLLRIFGNSRN